MSRSRRIVHDSEGLNTGEWPSAAADHFITPVAQFFTRSHAPAPGIDPATFRLEVAGLVDQPRQFSLADLGRFPRRRVASTVVCAGLRRDEYLSVPGELPWGAEPVSTGEWTGVPLAAVLRAAGIGRDARHVEFIGLDRVERQGAQFGFGGSIELDKAMRDEVLLATHLNDEPLPASHGYPLRAIVPGWIGARSVKWLGRIVVRETPSENYFQSRAYRVQLQVDAANPRDVSAGEAMSTVPLNSVILDPARDQVVPAGRLRLRGWAMGSAGRPLGTIEASGDGGRHWIPAVLTREGGPWAWSFWEATLDLAPGRQELVARATDTGGAGQPATVQETWNVKGYGNNAWHRVPITAA